jgi:hypothetical protein
MEKGVIFEPLQTRWSYWRPDLDGADPLRPSTHAQTPLVALLIRRFIWFSEVKLPLLC